MGVLKLSALEKQDKEFKQEMKIVSKDGKPYHVSNCGCPCECFIKQGEVRMDDIQVTAYWNID